MNMKLLVAAVLASAALLPAAAEAQERRGRGYRPSENRPYRPYRPIRPFRDDQWRPNRYWPGRVRRYHSPGWPYGYPRDYRWPYGRSYDIGNGRLWTPRGADVYYLPNGGRVYLPR